MALVQFAAGFRHSAGTTTGASCHHEQQKERQQKQEHKRRRLQKATPGYYFDTQFSSGKIIGDCIVGVQSCLEPRADDDASTGGRNHTQKQDCKNDQDQESSPQPRIGAHPRPLHYIPHFYSQSQTKTQPPSNFSDDSISLYSIHSANSSSFTIRANKMETETQLLHIPHGCRRRSKTPVFFVGQLERKSVPMTCTLELNKAQLLANEYQAVLPLRLKTSFINYNEDQYHDDQEYLKESYCQPKTPKRLRKIKCQLSLRDLVKQHSRCAPSPTTPPSTPGSGSDAETLVGSPPCSPLDEEFEKKSRSRSHSPIHAQLPLFSSQNSSLDSDDEQSLPALDLENDIGLKICTELLTHELATALFHRHPQPRPTSTQPGLRSESEPESETHSRSEGMTQDQTPGLQILLMIEAYEAVQQQVRRMLYDADVRGRQLDHVRDAERILDHWLRALYAVYDREQEESRRAKLGFEEQYEWPLRSLPEEGREVIDDR